jgi:anti-anti-sigma factor
MRDKPEMAWHLEVSRREIDQVIRLRLDGELDVASCPKLERELRLAERPGLAWLVVDLGGLTFMDLRGIRALLRAHERALAGGWQLLVEDVPRQLYMILWASGADEVLRITGYSPDASSRLHGRQQGA